MTNETGSYNGLNSRTKRRLEQLGTTAEDVRFERGLVGSVGGNYKLPGVGPQGLAGIVRCTSAPLGAVWKPLLADDDASEIWYALTLEGGLIMSLHAYRKDPDRWFRIIPEEADGLRLVLLRGAKVRNRIARELVNLTNRPVTDAVE